MSAEDETEHLEEGEEELEEAEAEAEAEEEAVDEGPVDANLSKLKEVQDKSFEEIRLPADVLAEAGQAWTTFITSANSREAAGEAIYAALFDSAPSLQSLFKTPRSVMAMRFISPLLRKCTWGDVNEPYF